MPADFMNAWAAGFFDGEGCMSVSRRKDTQSLAICMSAAQSVLEPLERLQQLYGGVVKLSSPSTKTQHRDVYKWMVNSAEAVRIIVPLWLPYLTTKRAQGEHILRIAELTQPRNSSGSRAYNLSTFDERMKLADEMKLMKRGLL